MAANYEIMSGQVFRDGDMVANIVGDKLEMVEGMEKYRVQAYKVFRKATGAVEPETETETSAPPTQKKAEVTVGDVLKPTKAFPSIPEPPARDERGDKTPAYVEWMHKYHSAEAEAKYASWYKKCPRTVQ